MKTQPMTQLRFGPPPASDFVLAPTNAQVEQYREEGFIAVERITTDEEIDWLRQIMDFVFDPANNTLPGAPVDRSAQHGASSTLQQAFNPELQFPELLQTTYIRNARRFAVAFLDRPQGEVSCWGHMIAKPPGGRSVPWHQDHAYWEPEFDYRALGCWLPLHDVTVEMGAMQFVRGSHKRGLVPHEHELEPQDNILTAVEPPDPGLIVTCPLKKGGATFHSWETLHLTAPNVTNRTRMAFPFEFQLTPRWRKTPMQMPWVDQRRAAQGTVGPREGHSSFKGDGKLLTPLPVE